jgi:hypothetical protein
LLGKIGKNSDGEVTVDDLSWVVKDFISFLKDGCHSFGLRSIAWRDWPPMSTAGN